MFGRITYAVISSVLSRAALVSSYFGCSHPSTCTYFNYFIIIETLGLLVSMQHGAIRGILIPPVLAPTEALCGIEIQIQPQDAELRDRGQ